MHWCERTTISDASRTAQGWVPAGPGGLCRFSECRGRTWRVNFQKLLKGLEALVGQCCNQGHPFYEINIPLAFSGNRFENAFPSTELGTGFLLSPAISLDTAGVIFSLRSHRLGAHTRRAHSAHDLDVHKLNHRAVLEVVPIPVVQPLSE